MLERKLGCKLAVHGTREMDTKSALATRTADANCSHTGLSPAFEILSSIFAVQEKIAVLSGLGSQFEKGQSPSSSGET